MFYPCPKPQKKVKQKKNSLKVKNKNPIPKQVKEEVRQRDNDQCRACGKPFDGVNYHHIIKRSQASIVWVHDKRNIECLCMICHSKTENDHKFRLSRERQAVIDFGWCNGKEMTLTEWEEWRNWEVWREERLGVKI